jgi:hypothetical protein
MNNTTETIEQAAERIYDDNLFNYEKYRDGFIAGANEMLPIIKELLEALIKTCPNVYDYKELINKAKNI